MVGPALSELVLGVESRASLSLAANSVDVLRGGQKQPLKSRFWEPRSLYHRGPTFCWRGLPLQEEGFSLAILRKRERKMSQKDRH